MFKYKTEAELTAMTPEQRDVYSEQKRDFEAKATEKMINDAIAKALPNKKEEVTAAVKAKNPGKTEEEIKALVDAEMKAEGETLLNVKKELSEIKETVNQLKESGGNTNKGTDLFALIEKSLTEALPTLKKMKAGEWEKGKELTMEIKAAINIVTTAVANASGVTTPDAVVYQGINSYATDVRPEKYVINYLSNGTTDRASLPYMDKIANQGDMAITAEGALKPLISITWELRYSTAVKIAGRTKVSEEALDDISFLMTAIRTELMYEHDIAEQDAVFTKIAAIAPGFTAGGMAASTTEPSNYDAIRAAIYGIRIASKGRYLPNVVLVPSADAYNMGATKDNTNQYVFPPFVLPNGEKISGVQIIEVNDGTTVADGSFIVGDFKKLHRLVYKAFTVRIGQGITHSATASEIKADFDSNMYTMVGESRLHLWIYENEKVAFIKSTFAAVKTAIEAPAV